jgi:hypothetical protein
MRSRGRTVPPGETRLATRLSQRVFVPRADRHRPGRSTALGQRLEDDTFLDSAIQSYTLLYLPQNLSAGRSSSR